MFSWTRKNWGHIVGSLVALMTFAPAALAVPSWSLQTDTTGGLLSIDPFTSGTTLILDYTPVQGSTYGTISNPATFTVLGTGFTTANQIGGTITGLNALKFSSGSFSLNVSANTSGDMYSNMFSTSPSPAPIGLTPQTATSVTVTFTFIGAQFSNASSPTTLQGTPTFSFTN